MKKITKIDKRRWDVYQAAKRSFSKDTACMMVRLNKSNFRTLYVQQVLNIHQLESHAGYLWGSRLVFTNVCQEKTKSMTRNVSSLTYTGQKSLTLKWRQENIIKHLEHFKFEFSND